MKDFAEALVFRVISSGIVGYLNLNFLLRDLKANEDSLGKRKMLVRYQPPVLPSSLSM